MWNVQRNVVRFIDTLISRPCHIVRWGLLISRPIEVVMFLCDKSSNEKYNSIIFIMGRPMEIVVMNF